MSDADMLRVDDPFTGEVAYEGPLASVEVVGRAIERAHAAHRAWATVPLHERIAALHRFIDAFEASRDRYALEVTRSMGKPVKQVHGEIDTLYDRARQMAGIAEEALAPERLPDEAGYERWISREPVGVAAVLAAWNYPLVIAGNPLIAAVLAGNAVVIKHSSRSPRCGEQLAEAFEKAGVPEGLVTAVHASHAVTEQLVQHPLIGYVSFTGSVGGGRRIQQAVANARFIDVTLELGGKDPAYVCADADFEFTVENVMDGALYNAGQSCCGVERVYVDAPIYDRFLEAAVEVAKRHRLDDPRLESTTMGPMAQPNAPDFLEQQVKEAEERGARVLVGGRRTSAAGRGRFFSPTVVADTEHRMSIARDESFGPVVAVQKVSSDDEAVELMNDSDLGLTASVWTSDLDRARRLLPRLEAGTVFLNRADYLDPRLAWTGFKDSGKGVSLSKLGFHAVTRPKSFHLRTKTR